MEKKRDLSKAEDHINAIEGSVDRIAFIRRMAETCSVDMEEFDRQLNALCDKYANKYNSMNEAQLAIHGMMELITHGEGDAVIKMFADEGEE